MVDKEIFKNYTSIAGLTDFFVEILGHEVRSQLLINYLTIVSEVEH